MPPQPDLRPDERLRELERLKSEGLLTDEEYAEPQRRIVADL